jgi:malonyl-CoA/methylmalonyl-CoA synthetase
MSSNTLFARLLEPDDKTALRVDGAALTYREFARAATRHLEVLRDAGVAPGERVGVWTHPSLATAVALAAHAAGGIVSVPLNPKLGGKELAHILADAAPKAVVGTDPALASRTPAHALVLAEVRLEGDAALTPLDLDDSPLLVLYTSGTTGAPKGAVITRRNVASNLDGLAEAWGWSDSDTVVHALPLFHVHGLVLGLFGALRAGGTLAWLAHFDTRALARALRGASGPTEASAPSLARGPNTASGRGAEATLLFAVPTMYHRLAEDAAHAPEVREGLRAARLLVSGSAGLPVREHRRIEELAGRGVIERYGLTETLINCAVRAETGPRPGYVGPALAGVEVRLVDDARGPIDVRDDATLGELAVRGPNVFAGYLNRPEATAAVLDDEGWFYTGDLATRTEDGSFRIVGRRATDLIKTGGFKVGAGEVEAALLEHPSVAEAAVLGAPDDDLGERIVAFVALHAGASVSAKELVDHVAAQLAPHKRPREVHLVESLPRNAMGKVVKGALRDARGTPR